MNEENWRPVAGYDGFYEVSDHGRIRSVERVDMRGQRRPSQVRKLSLKSTGRLQVSLSRDGVKHSHFVHRIVARAFHGEPPTGTEACHGDGNPTNNRADNLRWGTSSDNKLDAVRHGTHHEAVKTHCGRGHRLVEPNLVPAHARRGQRDCLACSRAHASGKAASEQTLRTIADQKYAAIIAAGRND